MVDHLGALGHVGEVVCPSLVAQVHVRQGGVLEAVDGQDGPGEGGPSMEAQTLRKMTEYRWLEDLMLAGQCLRVQTNSGVDLIISAWTEYQEGVILVNLGALTLEAFQGVGPDV